MKCINKRALAGLLIVSVFLSVTGCGKAKSVVENAYPVYGESSSVNVLSGAEDTVSSYFGANLCVGGTENIGQESVEHNSVAEAAGVFNTATNTITYFRFRRSFCGFDESGSTATWCNRFSFYESKWTAG